LSLWGLSATLLALNSIFHFIGSFKKTIFIVMNPYIGSVLLFAGNFAPKGWAICDGRLLSISQNSALFSILGVMYGGDGRTTFALPDLRGAAALGAGQMPGGQTYVQGERVGSETVTLLAGNLPAHSHGVKVPVTEASATNDVPGGRILAAQNSSFYAALNTADGNYGGVVMSPVGQNAPVDIRKPFVVLNYIIALQGIYPPRP
jgi:microcystin-dependent protein